MRRSLLAVAALVALAWLSAAGAAEFGAADGSTPGRPTGRLAVDASCRTLSSNIYTECMRRCRAKRDKSCRGACTRDYRSARRQCYGQPG